MKRTPIQRLARHFDLDLLRVMRRLEAELTDTRGPERQAWSEANIALSTARSHVRSIMSDEDRRAGV
jgi:hypothetical protein